MSITEDELVYVGKSRQHHTEYDVFRRSDGMHVTRLVAPQQEKPQKPESYLAYAGSYWQEFSATFFPTPSDPTKPVKVGAFYHVFHHTFRKSGCDYELRQKALGPVKILEKTEAEQPELVS